MKILLFLLLFLSFGLIAPSQSFAIQNPISVYTDETIFRLTFNSNISNDRCVLHMFGSDFYTDVMIDGSNDVCEWTLTALGVSAHYGEETNYSITFLDTEDNVVDVSDEQNIIFDNPVPEPTSYLDPNIPGALLSSFTAGHGQSVFNKALGLIIPVAFVLLVSVVLVYLGVKHFLSISKLRGFGYNKDNYWDNNHDKFERQSTTHLFKR